MNIELNDGTIIANGRAGYSSGFLWLFFTGMTMQQAALIAFDPNKTARIVFHYGEMQDEYENFTDCRVLQVNVDGEIAVCMARGAADADS